MNDESLIYEPCSGWAFSRLLTDGGGGGGVGWGYTLAKDFPKTI